MLAPEIQDSRVLDLYAGTGALGIEAVSRGAAAATFIEQDAEALKCLRQNLAVLGEREFQVIGAPVNKGLARLRPAYDLVFLDPPYDDGLIPGTLEQLLERDLLAEGALVMCEHRPKTPPALDHPIVRERLEVVETRAWGDVAITFLRAIRPKRGEPS